MKILSLLLSLTVAILANLAFHSSASAEDINLDTGNSNVEINLDTGNSDSQPQASEGCQIDRINSLLSSSNRAGFGAETTGGAQAQSFTVVTSSADSGEGSLREALSQEGALWITFDEKIHGETISLTRTLSIENSDVTIDGRGDNGKMSAVTISAAGETSFPLIHLRGGNTVIHGITIAGRSDGFAQGISISEGEDYWLDHLTLKDFRSEEALSITRGPESETAPGFISISSMKAENSENSITVSLGEQNSSSMLSVFNSDFSSVQIDAGSKLHLFNNFIHGFSNQAIQSATGSMVVAENNVVSGESKRQQASLALSGAGTGSGTILSLNNQLEEGARDFGSVSPAEREPFDIPYASNLLASEKVEQYVRSNAGAENAPASIEVCPNAQPTENSGTASQGTFDLNTLKQGEGENSSPTIIDQENFQLIFSATEEINSNNALITFGFSQSANAHLLWGSGDNYQSQAHSQEGNVRTHTINLSGLESGQAYVYRIVGRNDSGDTVRSRKFSFTTGAPGQSGENTTPESLRNNTGEFTGSQRVEFTGRSPEIDPGAEGVEIEDRNNVSFSDGDSVQFSGSSGDSQFSFEESAGNFNSGNESLEPTLPTSGESSSGGEIFSASSGESSFASSTNPSGTGFEASTSTSQLSEIGGLNSSTTPGLPSAATAQTLRLAFPGAEGFGNQAAGGRGGTVVYVDNLKDDGGGSLREALETTGARTIVFRVSGTISLDSTLEINDPFITIAGQTAPGGGVLLRHNENSDFEDALIRINTNDVIVRHIRLRRGSTEDSSCCGSNIEFGPAAQNVIVDHVSMSWSRGDQIQIASGSNITIQNSIISESLPVMEQPVNPNQEEETPEERVANLTSLPATPPQGVSLIRNLFAQSANQNPELLGNQAGAAQLINNLVFNACGVAKIGGSSNSAQEFSTLEPTETGRISISGSQSSTQGGEGASFDIFGNVDLTGCPSGGKSIVIEEGARTELQGNVFGEEAPEGGEAPTPSTGAAPFSFIATSELEEKLLATVGATLPKRDAVDTRLIEGIRNDLAKSIADPEEVGGFPELEGEHAYLDSDRDGMPDDWEITTGLNPENASDANLDMDSDGYTNLEEFLNGTLPNSAALPGETPVIVEETVDPDIQSTLGLEATEEGSEEEPASDDSSETDAEASTSSSSEDSLPPAVQIQREGN